MTHPLKVLSVAAVLTLVACGGGNGSDPRTQPARGTAWVVFDAATVVAEVAQTQAELRRGLMLREEVPDGTGMLFVFETAEPISFWMKDTYAALDIAFMDADFRIVNIEAMRPEDTSFIDSDEPAMFALEVRQGWFAEHGIEAGTTPRVIFGR